MNPTHEKMLRYFQFEHLPERLQAVSAPFWELACTLAGRANPEDDAIPADAAETTVALRKLLEAKDAAVRAALPIPAGRKVEL